ncbi:LysR family transcriptional regulator (chromosome initiation inhibitor) [Rhizobium rosettiformans]|uniref:LysR family transcriptional regulator ArgP n=2 Tax=Rhizobium rosettiformans TaxID=1368430 RepID=A0A4S8PUV3_9HYPH|nr:LysR family transcriptional regulator ArgP [Rhizobium rosettiformans]MBB5276874.1 LysR family transcriptional regulator (chromosome initiation inhibitor) [Rhizobium rosettiformans]THV35290.1 LysR family transcriptional regulator ArgP [Rhizobium rosettiformans W3]
MFDPAQLSALAAVLRSGSFERAAQMLHVTQSAISQRVRQLEEQVGTPLIIRSQPCRATEAGERLFRHAEELQLLEQGVRRDLGLAGQSENETQTWPTLRLAVNADSLATWFVPAMAAVEGVLFDLVIDDQDHSAEWLQRGEVRAAISGSPRAVQGCDCRPLGALRYLATASPAYIERWFGDGKVAPAEVRVAPVITFNAKDRLQTRWAEMALGTTVTGPSHWLPSSHAFVDAAIAGLGWGMNPEPLVSHALADGRLCELVPGQPLDVPLYWHVSRSISAALKPLTASVIRAASAVLRPIG